MNIVYIHQYFETPDQFGGLRSYRNSLHMIGKDHKVTVITGSAHYHGTSEKTVSNRKLIEEEIIDGINIIWIKSLIGYHKSYLGRFLSFMGFMILATWAGMRCRADVVYATSPPLTVIVPGYLISRIKRAKLIFEVRDLWPESAVKTGILTNRIIIKVAEWLESFAYKTSNQIVAVSGGIKDALSLHGISPEKIHIVTHGADLEYVYPLKEKNNKFREKYSLEGKFTAIYAGSFGWANSLETIIEAAKLLEDRNDIRIVLLGGGKEKSELEELVKRYKLKNIIFAEPVPKSEIASAVGAADVGLMVLRDVSTFATVLPNKLLDYMGCGIPVIINFKGYASDIVTSADAGLLVAPGNPEALRDAILQLAENPQTGSKMGRQGRKHIEKYFSRDATAQQFEDVLLDTV